MLTVTPSGTHRHTECCRACLLAGVVGLLRVRRGALIVAVTARVRAEDQLLGGGDDDLAGGLLAEPERAGKRVLVRAGQG